MKSWTPKQLAPAFPRPGNKAGSPHTDLLPRAASPSAPSGLNCLLGAAASSPRSLLYPRRHEVTAAAKQAARQGARNLSGPRAPPLNPSANRRIQGSHVTGGGWPPRGQDGMGVGNTEAGAGLLQGRRANRGRGSLRGGGKGLWSGLQVPAGSAATARRPGSVLKLMRRSEMGEPLCCVCSLLGFVVC